MPKKEGITVFPNEKKELVLIRLKELVPIRLVTGWRVCMDYRKLNKKTQKGHFPMSFMDQT